MASAIAEAPCLPAELAALDHPIDQTVGECLLAGEVAVTLHVGVHSFDRLSGVPGVELIDPGPERQYLLGMDLDIAGLALETPRGLVDQDPTVRQRHPLAGR